ncbi:uncharacterized protein LOC106532045 [Austrofundulus limnaeus]|uniref:Uncharacterized protein LOC106532045 n=1 Tax=Austrofundulus limnaeus TaxID=52670 RepID=A0A2I4CU17_AUSLI|nr:PREDICTED: uncharacterized protein LOC106532045 [Austrofundulus limnaeus]
MVPHAVDILLLQSRLTSLSPARQITYTALLLSQPHITIHRCNVLNPATLLPLPTDGTPHDCVDLSEKLQLPRPDLQDTPLETGPTWFVDSSSSKAPDGKNLTGFAVVQLPDIVICAEQLPGHFSAQAAEIIALTTAFRLGEGKEVTVYTDSQYAFSTLFYFAKQWEQRGMTTSTGKPVTHATLLKELLHKIMLPSRLAVCKCAAHTGGKDLISMGNHLADITAKAAAAGHHSHSHFLSHTDFEIDSDILSSTQEHAPRSEKKSWLNRGAIKTQFWVIKNKPILPRSLFHAAAISTHGLCHVSTGGMIEIIHKFFFTIGLEAYLKQFCKQCTVCIKHNPQGNMRPKRGVFPKPSYPFQTMYMDFIELNQSGPYKYCLVMVDAFSKWVEIVPTAKPDAISVAKAICKNIIPYHGIPETLYSDNGTHFVNDIIKNMADHLQITLKNHCAYHPQSAGLVERMNGTIKSRLKKCMEETGRPWPDCLDLVKLYMRVTPTTAGPTPFEILHGRPYRLPVFDLDKVDEETTLADYMIKTLKLKEVQSANLLPSDSSPPQVTKVTPGNWVFIKVNKRKGLEQSTLGRTLPGVADHTHCREGRRAAILDPSQPL